MSVLLRAIFVEIVLFFYFGEVEGFIGDRINQYKPICQWHAFVLWGRNGLDDDLSLAYELFRPFLKTVYLDQLLENPSSLGLSIIQFVTIPESQAPQQAQHLLNQVRQEIGDAVTQANVIELVEKIIIYKFPHKSRQELEQMFDLAEWKQTQFYKDVKLEGKLEGKLETIPLLKKLGLTVEQIAQELEIDVALVRQSTGNQNN